MRSRTASFLLAAAVVIIACAGCGDTPESLEREAKGYLAKGDRVSAAIQYKSLLALDPGHADAHFQLGKILAEVGRPEAEDSLRRALDSGKPAGDVIPVLGRVLLDQEKYKEVRVLLEPDPKRSQPTDPKALAEIALLRAFTYLGQRDFTSANTQIQLATIALPEKAKLAAASLAVARGERAEAETLINEVIATNPGSADAQLALGELRRTADELDKALPHYAQAAKLEPNNVNTLLIYAIGLVNTDRVAEAQPLIEQAKKLAPPGPVLFFAQALIECRTQRYQQCAELLDKVFDISPQYMPGLLLSGQLNYATGNFEQSLGAFVRYLERSPADQHARKLLAGTLLAQSNAPAALRVLRPLMVAENKGDPQLLGLTGQVMLQLGHVRQARESLDKAVQLVPGNAELRTALALSHLASGMRRRAEAEFRAAIALQPPNSKADYGLIMMLLGENRIEQAQQAVAAVEQRLPVKPETHMLRGVVSRAAGDAGGARKAFERAAKIDPDYFPAIRELAELDIEGGNESAGRARIEAVLRKNGTHVDALLTMARIEFSAGRRVEGLAWARQASDAHPESTKALLMVVEAQADAGELNAAIQSARQALKLRPRDPRVLSALGNLQLASKDYSGAAVTFSNLVSIQPGSVEAHVLLASAYVMGGDATTAISVARNALARNPRSLGAMTLLGDMLLEGKKYADVLEFARKVQKGNPKLALGFRLEGDALLGQGDARRAIAAFETAAKLAPSGLMLTKIHRALSVASPGSEREAPLEEWIRKNPDDSTTRTYLAEMLNAKGRHKEAIVHYMELARRYPNDARTLNNLAWALHAVGDAQAVQYAEQAYKLKPGEAPVLDTYGWILVNHGKLLEGIQILLQAVALDGKNPEIRYHLAKGLAQAGDKVRARTELKKILSTGKTFPQADDARALLAALGS